jgi:hypothetical protein
VILTARLRLALISVVAASKAPSRPLGVAERRITNGASPAAASWAQIVIPRKLREHSLALELQRLDELHEVFAAQAKAGDVQAGALAIRISEQRRILPGLALPPRPGDHHLMVEAVAEPEYGPCELAVYA